MAKTEVFLTINRLFVQGPQYRVTLNDYEVIIDITLDNKFPFQTYYVKMTFPFIIVDNTLSSSKIKENCVIYLNRLLDVVRYNTKFYHIEQISENDIVNFDFITTDERGKQRQGAAWDLSGPFFPLNSIAESDVFDKILNMLKNGDKVPLNENLMLDSYRYFAKRQFNIAVILGNVALESIVAAHLYDKLVAKGLTKEESRRKISDIFSLKKSDGEKGGLHKVLKKDFTDIDERDFYTGSGLWIKFNTIRTIRKNVVHPSITNLSHDKALEILKDIEEIVKWISR
jgi:hypothetical protein